jgi:hypothetical protein
LHFLCSQLQAHDSWHGLQGIPHLLLHWLWRHLFRHFCLQGGQLWPQNSLHTWPQINVRPHLIWHVLCNLFWWHSPQLPPQMCPHSRTTPQSLAQIFSWSSIFDCLEHSISTLWPQIESMITIDLHLLESQTAPHTWEHWWPHNRIFSQPL